MAARKKSSNSIQPLDPRPPSQITLEVITNTIEEWKRENTPEVIKEKALRILEQNSKQIVTKLLGFSDSWGRFELDHCNGRAGESEAGKFFADQQRIVVKEWLSQVELPTLSAADKKAVISDLKSTYAQAYRSELRTMVINAAKNDAETAFKEISASTLLESIDKTNKLLDL